MQRGTAVLSFAKPIQLVPSEFSKASGEAAHRLRGLKVELYGVDSDGPCPECKSDDGFLIATDAGQTLHVRAGPDEKPGIGTRRLWELVLVTNPSEAHSVYALEK
jgi:hypothetical protein